jgi:hypothetical protein
MTALWTCPEDHDFDLHTAKCQYTPAPVRPSSSRTGPVRVRINWRGRTRSDDYEEMLVVPAAHWADGRLYLKISDTKTRQIPGTSMWEYTIEELTE